MVGAEKGCRRYNGVFGAQMGVWVRTCMFGGEKGCRRHNGMFGAQMRCFGHGVKGVFDG